MTATGAFHIVYNSAHYDATIAFYRDGLELPIISSWDERPEARGTLFQAAGGIIEVMAHPTTEAHTWQVFPSEVPQGVAIAVEVPDVDAWYQRACDKGLPIRHPLSDFNWEHRAFTLNEPSGVVVYIFSAHT